MIKIRLAIESNTSKVRFNLLALKMSDLYADLFPFVLCWTGKLRIFTKVKNAIPFVKINSNQLTKTLAVVINL